MTHFTENGTTTNFGLTNVSTTGPQTLAVGGSAQSNALMIMNLGFTCPTTTPETVTSVTDSEGNTWQLLHRNEAHAGWHLAQTVHGANVSFAQEIWYTKGATINSSIDVTVAFSNTVDSITATFSTKILGADATDAFDLNPSLPAVVQGINSTAETVAGISTDTTNILPVWCFAAWGVDFGLSNVAFDGSNRNEQESRQLNGTNEFVRGQIAHSLSSGPDAPGVTGPYSSVSFVSPTNASNFFLTAVVLTADVQSMPVVDPLDGTQILEWGGNSIPARRYQEADYDSIWSRGDRVANGLMTVGHRGFLSMFADTEQAFDNLYGTGIGNGPTPGGGTFDAFGASIWWDTAPWYLELHGIKWLGTETINDNGDIWAIAGGFELGSIVNESYAREFDQFSIAQTATDPELGGSLKSRTLEFTPRTPVSWPHFEITNALSATLGDDRLANELLLKVTHSILDGGDRRSTNGRPTKQVAFAMSSNWQFSSSSGFADPASSLFDGLYNRSGSSESDKGGADLALISSVTGSGQHPQTTAGEYLQFEFPRKVRFHHIVFNLANGDLEANDSGGNPTMYGKWHWEVSDGGAYVPIGGTWQFTEDSEFMVAPAASPADGFGLVDDGGHLKWRMVLDAGPAFGTDKALAQVIFHLDDRGNQEEALTVDFTDDTDSVLPVLQPPVAGNPFVIVFTDNTDDALTLTLTNIPNPPLSIAFTDGTSDQLDLKSDLFPSSVVQVFTFATGR